MGEMVPMVFIRPEVLEMGEMVEIAAPVMEEMEEEVVMEELVVEMVEMVVIVNEKAVLF